MKPQIHFASLLHSAHNIIRTKALTLLLLPAILLAGCATEDPKAVAGPQRTDEKGPQNTVIYLVPVESSEPGAKIEVNGKVEGVAPLTIKVFGDRDGTFHNFGSDDFTVRAYSPRTEQYPQSRIFKTGTFGVKDDKIPQRIYFDFSAPGQKTK
jgi:hypothetical protein